MYAPYCAVFAELIEVGISTSTKRTHFHILCNFQHDGALEEARVFDTSLTLPDWTKSANVCLMSTLSQPVFLFFWRWVWGKPWFAGKLGLSWKTRVAPWIGNLQERHCEVWNKITIQTKTNGAKLWHTQNWTDISIRWCLMWCVDTRNASLLLLIINEPSWKEKTPEDQAQWDTLHRNLLSQLRSCFEVSFWISRFICFRRRIWSKVLSWLYKLLNKELVLQNFKSRVACCAIKPC